MFPGAASLLRAGAEPDGHRDEYDKTALMMAAARGREAAARLLLEAKADPQRSRELGK